MSIIISHQSAIELLRTDYVYRTITNSSRATLQHPPAIPRKPPHVNEKRELWKTLHEILGTKPELPIHVSITNSNTSYQTKGLKAHILNNKIPKSAFFEILPNLYLTLPEFLPVQISRSCTVLELALLASELMGTYYIDQEGKLKSRESPLVTRKDFERFLRKNANIPGYAKVWKALAFSCEKAASPMEVKLFIRATLPCSKGGYGLGKIRLNQEYKVKKLTSQTKAFAIRKPDLLFEIPKTSRDKQPWKAITLEYNGQYHTTVEQQIADGIRHNELVSAGIKNYQIDKEIYYDFDYMQNLVECIRKDIGLPECKLPHAKQTIYRKRQRDLVKLLDSFDLIRWGTNACRENHP